MLLAYQIAELQRSNLVKKAGADVWVSDKYGTLASDCAVSDEYRAYLDKLKSSRADDDEEHCVPGAQFWQATEQYPNMERVNSVIPLDVKYCSVSAITAFFESNRAEQWCSLGIVEPPVHVATPEEKKRHKLRCREERCSILAKRCSQTGMFDSDSSLDERLDDGSPHRARDSVDVSPRKSQSRTPSLVGNDSTMFGSSFRSASGKSPAISANAEEFRNNTIVQICHMLADYSKEERARIMAQVSENLKANEGAPDDFLTTLNEVK